MVIHVTNSVQDILGGKGFSNVGQLSKKCFEQTTLYRLSTVGSTFNPFRRVSFYHILRAHLTFGSWKKRTSLYFLLYCTANSNQPYRHNYVHRAALLTFHNVYALLPFAIFNFSTGECIKKNNSFGGGNRKYCMGKLKWDST